MNIIKLGVIAILATALIGCSAASTAIKKQDLVVESNVSYSIVLEPLAPKNRIVYARVRDLSGNKMRRSMQQAIENNLRQEGFTLTQDPDEANLMLDATIIKADKTTGAEARNALSEGYKGGGEGAVLAGGLTAATGGSGNAVLGTALAGAAIGFLADTLIEDVYFTFIMDVQLRERPLDGDSITNNLSNKNRKGLRDKNLTISSNSESKVKRGDNYNWIVHQTRMVTTANKMNLDIKEAVPSVQETTAYNLAEMLM